MKPRSTNEVYINIYIILKKLTAVFMYKSALRLRGVFALRLISSVLLYAFSVYVCFVLFCIVSWLNMFLALYLPINTLNLEPLTPSTGHSFVDALFSPDDCRVRLLTRILTP